VFPFQLLFACCGIMAWASAAEEKVHPSFPGIIDATQAGPDHAVQGEYAGSAGGQTLAAQVIALGNDRFQAVFLHGGLPGAGWDKSPRQAVDGRRDGGQVRFAAAKGPKEYLGRSPDAFSALEKQPADGQPDFKATWTAGELKGTTPQGVAFALKRVERASPTLGMQPPEKALVLLAYTPGQAPDLDQWSNKAWQARPDGSMLVIHPDRTKGDFSTCAVAFGTKPFHFHLEFATAFMPASRGQARSNSGVFLPPGREIQVLDSFGLEGLANECGGIYKDIPPVLNMALPPLAWQTYDVDYQLGTAGGKPSYHIVLNGVVVHERVELGAPLTKPGNLRLQDHLNNVLYRNIWVQER
jgi:hypothetical protein